MKRPIVAAGCLCLLLLCCSARAEAPDSKLPSSRCLTPEGKELDFADLVARECGKPEKLANKSSPMPKATDGPKAPSFMVTQTELEKKKDNDCERALTASELQRNIVEAADARCVAQILIQTESVGGIEDGYRIDPDFNFLPNCKNRELDPDVVALKGVALGVVEGSSRDSGLVDKVADGIVASLTPPGEMGMKKCKPAKSMKKPPSEPTPKGSDGPQPPSFVVTEAEFEKEDCDPHGVDREDFVDVLRNLTLLRETFDENPNNSPPCFEPPAKPAKTKSGRRSLLSNLFGGGRAVLSAKGEFFSSSGRQLQCSACDNADSYMCSYCWKKEVCDDMYWCNGR